MFGDLSNQLWNLTPSILASSIVQGSNIAMRLIGIFALEYMSMAISRRALFRDA